MSRTKQAIAVVAVMLTMAVLVVGFDQGLPAQQWEYRVVQFSREQRQLGMAKMLKVLGDQGWEYAGPLANNSLNAQYVAFKRPKQ
jgi:hypothetical protein